MYTISNRAASQYDVPVIVQARQLTAIGAEPVQQLWYRLPAIGVALADALPWAMPHDGPRVLRGRASVHSDRSCAYCQHDMAASVPSVPPAAGALISYLVLAVHFPSKLDPER
jgi:hypothetical protein